MNKVPIVAVSLAAVVFIGCRGEASISDPNGDSTIPIPGETNNGLNNVSDPFPEIPCEGIACEDPVPTVTPRVTRLTHRQWENTVRDLLRLDAQPGLSDNFIEDTLGIGHFDRLADNLTVTPPLWDDYREAAESLAAQVASDPAALDKIVPKDAPADLEGRSRAFVEAFGERAYRRPLTEDEVQRHLDLMAEAPEVFANGGSFEKAAELVIRAILQSPNFLYRIETNTSEQDYVALSAYERASKLSYALWNSMPDDALLQAAAEGRLDDHEQLSVEVDRMLDDPRSVDAIADFHAQLLGFEHFREMSKAAEVFPDYNDETPAKLERELELYIEDVVFDSDGTYRTLMTATHSFVDAELAAIYGVQPPATDFGRVELDPNRRQGLLTRAGFLALNATPYDPNPIHRGVFVDERILCMHLPAPPDDFTIPDGVEGNTNRERIENATGECGGQCHTPLINPPGFAFEHFDAMGGYREMDGTFPVDATGSLVFDREEKSWSDANELVSLLAESPQAHECYVRNWFEYVNGRLPGDGDEPLIARLGQASHSGDVTIKELLVALTTSNVFLNRDTRNEQ